VAKLQTRKQVRTPAHNDDLLLHATVTFSHPYSALCAPRAYHTVADGQAQLGLESCPNRCADVKISTHASAVSAPPEDANYPSMRVIVYGNESPVWICQIAVESRSNLRVVRFPALLMTVSPHRMPGCSRHLGRLKRSHGRQASSASKRA